MVRIKRVDHLGIRVTDEAASSAFYGKLGFTAVYRDKHEPVVILTHPYGVEINFIVNADTREAA